MLHELLNALQETLFMVFTAGFFTFILGLPLGVLLYVTRPGQILSNVVLNKTLGTLVNAARSVPYIVFMVALIPLTRIVAGSGEGSGAACVPLTLAAIPFFARLTENAFAEIPKGLIEAAQSVGATPFQIIRKVLIPEAMSGIISAITVTLIHLVGYSAMAGAIGGGGLGSLAIHKGYHAFQTNYIIATVILLIALVQIIQICGDYIVHGSFRKH